MSLITDTLNKMKKEQGSEENDEKMMAPPALRNAVINQLSVSRVEDVEFVNGDAVL